MNDREQVAVPATTPTPVWTREWKTTFFDRHPRLLSLLFSSPFLIFLAFPMSAALQLGLGTVRGALCAVLALAIGVASTATWVFNPVPPESERPTTIFMVTTGLLLSAQIAYWLFAWNVGLRMSYMLIAYSATAWMLQAPRRLIMPGLAFLLLLTTAEIYVTRDPLWGVLVVAASTLFCGISRLSIMRQHEREMEHQHALLLTQERERTRLSSDLHDILGHSLTGITMKAQLASRLLDADRVEDARQHIDDLLEMSRDAMKDVRSIVAATRVVTPDEEIEAARALAEIAGVELVVSGEGRAIPTGIRSSYAGHLIREGVTNAIAHSYPTRILISVTPQEVSVVNDGYSSQRSQSTTGSGTGLAGLRDRVGNEGMLTWGALGGTWHVTLRFPDEAPRSRPEEKS